MNLFSMDVYMKQEYGNQPKLANHANEVEQMLQNK